MSLNLNSTNDLIILISVALVVLLIFILIIVKLLRKPKKNNDQINNLETENESVVMNTEQPTNVVDNDYMSNIAFGNIQETPAYQAKPVNNLPIEEPVVNQTFNNDLTMENNNIEPQNNVLPIMDTPTVESNVNNGFGLDNHVNNQPIFETPMENKPINDFIMEQPEVSAPVVPIVEANNFINVEPQISQPLENNVSPMIDIPIKPLFETNNSNESLLENMSINQQETEQPQISEALNNNVPQSINQTNDFINIPANNDLEVFGHEEDQQEVTIKPVEIPNLDAGFKQCPYCGAKVATHLKTCFMCGKDI
jgi:hypothetical protein